MKRTETSETPFLHSDNFLRASNSVSSLFSILTSCSLAQERAFRYEL